MDNLFNSSRDEDVALFEQHVLSLVCLCAGETDNRAILYPVVFQSLKLVFRNGFVVNTALENTIVTDSRLQNKWGKKMYSIGIYAYLHFTN